MFNANESTIEERKQQFKDLEKQFKQYQCHPIILFGTASSGKSAFLQSMIYYGATTGDKGFILTKGVNMYPPDYDNSNELYKRSVIFYENVAIKDRGEGRYPQQTQTLHQFFIPVDLQPANDELPLQRLAFLEGTGEFFHPGEGLARDGVGQYPKLTETTHDLISNYDAPLSLLFFAPMEITGGAGNAVDERTSYLSLSNQLREYFGLRPKKFQHRDNLCLLLTKWDTTCRLVERKGASKIISYNDIINGAFPNALRRLSEWEDLWATFSDKPDFSGERFLMPYSSGVDVDGCLQLDHIQQPDFDYFNRTMWNWLYGNATAEYSIGNTPSRKTLCPDTQPTVTFCYTSLEHHSIKLVAMKLFNQVG